MIEINFTILILMIISIILSNIDKFKKIKQINKMSSDQIKNTSQGKNKT